MGLLFLFASYTVFYHVGRLLMRLVVVQPVGDGGVASWCFASTFSLSLSLFIAVLADMAHASFFSSSAVVPQDSRVKFALQRLQQLAKVQPGEFSVVLFCLLATVLLVCPTVVTLSFLQHLFCRGGGGGVGTHRGGVRNGRRSRRSSSTGKGEGRGGGSRRGSVSSEGRRDFLFDLNSNDRRRGRWGCWCRMRTLLMVVLMLLLLSGSYWTLRTDRLKVKTSAQRVAGVGRAVYRQLQAYTALFKVPQEIESSGPARDMTVMEKGVEEGGGTTLPPATALNPREAAKTGGERHEELWTLGLRTFSAASVTLLDLFDIVRTITSRVAVVGVAMIGLLAGYAAITSPWLFLAPYVYYRGREEELRKAQQNFTKKLCYVLSNYGSAQRQIAALQYAVLHEEWTSPVFSGDVHHELPPLELPPGFSCAETSSYHTHSTPDTSFYSSLQQQGPSPQGDSHQFVESPSATKRYPPPPRRDSSSSKPLGTITTSIDTPPTASTGAVRWLQRKWTSAAAAVTGGIAGRSFDSPSSQSSSAMSPVLSRQRAITRLKKLREESKGARFLCLSLYLQLNEVEGMLRDAQRGGTWVGRWYGTLGIVTAFYSAIKVLLTAASLWFFKASTQDPVTRAVTLLEDTFILRRRDRLSGTSFSVTAIEVSTHVILALALVVNGWMVLSSIRGALLALFHVTMSFSGSAISRPATVAVGLSMLVGVYFVGQLVLLRSSLPGSSQWQTREMDKLTQSAYGSANVLLQVLGMLPYYYYQRLNDSCFLVGCLGAVIVRCFVLRNVLSSTVYTASGGEER